VSEEQLKRLYLLYRPDFLLFGYSFQVHDNHDSLGQNVRMRKSLDLGAPNMKQYVPSTLSLIFLNSILTFSVKFFFLLRTSNIEFFKNKNVRIRQHRELDPAKFIRSVHQCCDRHRLGADPDPIFFFEDDPDPDLTLSFTH
jgi:hypothetical protein